MNAQHNSHTDRHTDTQTHKDTDRQTDRQTDTETVRWGSREWDEMTSALSWWQHSLQVNHLRLVMQQQRLILNTHTYIHTYTHTY